MALGGGLLGIKVPAFEMLLSAEGDGGGHWVWLEVDFAQAPEELEV